MIEYFPSDMEAQQITYDLYFSLGGACGCTQILRYCQLQFASYPFDWVFGASITERAEILANHFSGMLQQDAMELIKENATGSRTNNWLNKRNGIEFMHDFHYGVPLEEEFPKVAEKYQRRGNRLIQQITTSKRVLAVYAERPCDKQVLPDEALCAALQILRKAFPKVEVDLLYIYSDDSVLIPEASISEIPDSGVSKIGFGYNMFNVYAPYEVNLPMAAHALRHFLITDLHAGTANQAARVRFQKRIPTVEALVRRQKLGIRIARMVMESDLCFRCAKIWQSIMKHFYKKSA